MIAVVILLIIGIIWIAVKAGNDEEAPVYSEDEVVSIKENSDYRYNIYGDGTVGILNYIGTNSIITVPEKINGYAVGLIGNRAFAGNSNLRSVAIASATRMIEPYAFADCVSLKTVTMPSNSVNYIGEYAFRTCDSLTCIDIPESVTFIGENAFFYCDKLEKVTVYNKDVSYGGSSVFSLCYKLTLYGYEGSTTQTYADNIKKPFVSIIERGSCGDNLSFMLYGDGTLEIYGEGDMWNCSYTSSAPWYSNITSIEKVIIKDGVTSVGESAFSFCTSLVSINIPESVTSIGMGGFFGCEDLANIDIPKSVTSIGERAFSSCTSLASINIPDGVTSIGDFTFYNCTSLTSIVIPDSVATISEWAFDGCTKLSTVNYIGTEEEWNKITIGSNNSPLLGANIIFLLEKDSVPFEGAQIRTEGEQGLRFIFRIPKVLSENCLEFGSVVMPKKYLGENALEIGLVDEIGTIEDAIRFAAVSTGASGPEEVQIVEYPKPQTTFDILLESLGGSTENVFAGTPFENVYDAFIGWNSDMTGKAYARLPYEICIR